MDHRKFTHTRQKVGILSLGCPRNLVDSEIILGLLKKEGFVITDKLDRCDVLLINTCAFVEDAKRESLDYIFQAIELKRSGDIKKIVICGCLPQRYPAVLKKELKEVDVFIGISDYKKVPEVVRLCLNGKKGFVVSKNPHILYDHTFERIPLSDRHYVYIKLTEGCNNRCSYCSIPMIRGQLRSREIESIIMEVKSLFKKRRVSEINLVGQDITAYGLDLYGEPRLAELIRRIAEIIDDCWIRLLYTHPAHFTQELIETIKDIDAVCKYVDIPIQHINDNILTRMNRKVKKEDIVRLIENIRSSIPEIGLRTSLIVGFPGEGEDEFKELMEFVKWARFERLGVFKYSREEGTPAFSYKRQVPEKVKAERYDAIMQLQQEISCQLNMRFQGRRMKVLLDQTGQECVGRSQYDAPEVDGVVFVKSKRAHRQGDFVDVQITGTMEYDLIGDEI